jgi:23S rRNA (uracil1939-C5)-methyltransferase
VTLRVGDEIELTIDALAAGGEGIGRLDGLAVFVPWSAPGDRIRARVIESRRRFARAEIAELVEPGPDRREPPCPWFARCGGCSWMHVSEEAQRRARVAIVRDALRRIGGASELPEIGELVSPLPLGYRARARIAYAHGSVGFRAARSHDVVDVAYCAVLDPRAAQEFERVRASRPRGRGEIEIRSWENVLRVGDENLRVSPDSFFQANASLWEVWRQRVVESCGRGELAVELYAGVGFYTTGLVENFRRVIAVERGRAVRDARKNTRAEVVHAAAEDWAPGELPSLAPDLVLVNPPRAGCHPALVEAIAAAPPRRVVYVSCDPSTLARDFRALAHTFRIAELCVIDALPQTHHVEALCVFESLTS